MRISCHQCSASQVLDETELEDGIVRTECTECEALLFVDQSGRVFSTEGALATANGVTPERTGEDTSDAYLTVPLPPLAELGLNPTPKGTPMSPPPPPVGSPTPPPSPVATTNLDDDDDELIAPAPPPPVAPPVAARVAHNTAGSPAPSDEGEQSGRYTVSIPVPPITRHGWMVFAGLALGGLLLGAILAGGEAAGQAPFDRAAGLRALEVGAKNARSCLADGTTELAGSIELRFAPSGKAEHLKVQGGLSGVPERDCIRDEFEALEVPAFTGPPVVVKQRLALH